MHKISNFGRMTPAAFGISRFHGDVQPPQQQPQPLRRPPTASSINSTHSDYSTVHLSFNVPFSSNLAGPERDEVLHASPGAMQRWLFPAGTSEETPTHELPVHVQNQEALRRLCKDVMDKYHSRIEATVTVVEAQPGQGLQARSSGLVTNVCIAGDRDAVYTVRANVLSQTPIMMKSAVIDIDPNMIVDPSNEGTALNIKPGVLNHIDACARYTGTDMFLLKPRSDCSSALTATSSGNGVDSVLDQRFRVHIFGDSESVEHAKTRTLMMVDQILRHQIDVVKLDLTAHTLVSGRSGKNIKMIEAATKTAIYFPPPFPGVFGYVPPDARRRQPDEIFITGETEEQINQAKRRLTELVKGIKSFSRDVILSPNKIDNILLDRLDKVKKIMEANSSQILLPPLGSRRGLVRVQGMDGQHVERTVKELMALAGQFYSASWWLMLPDPMHSPGLRAPTSEDVRVMLTDVCSHSGADLSFDKLTFHVNGSDDAVKQALFVIGQIPFVKRYPCQLRIKIELANEHKEFVSGKKNGKINKIMGQSNVQIIFDGFNEYNFYIDVVGSQYDAAKNGLDLVEAEMPAQISFHVPDQYHKRIIGIGGQHIQKIMKKYSVFVKFSNAMDRGGPGKEDEDVKIDNVICRTPARNAQSLDAVKQEIMDMVEKADAEFVAETVVINRLYHRELIARLIEIEELEKKWNCKIDFPSTEQASDVVTISGPEYQVPQAVDAFLGMVPESHEIAFGKSEELDKFFESAEFTDDLRLKMRSQYEVDVHVNPLPEEIPRSATASLERIILPASGRLVLTYTRNNAGGLKDAIDFLISQLVPQGLDASTIKGAIPRPKSDSFEDSLPFFESKLLQNAPSLHLNDSPTRSIFLDGETTPVSERSSLFDKLRKPGSIGSFSSFMSRKNTNNKPGNFFPYASSNASKASLISMESRESGYRNFWNDSGVNLPDEDNASISSKNGGWPARFSENKFPFSNSLVTPGDKTPRHDSRGSNDSGRPPTSHSFTSLPVPGFPSHNPHHNAFSAINKKHHQHHAPANGSAPNLNLPLR